MHCTVMGATQLATMEGGGAPEQDEPEDAHVYALPTHCTVMGGMQLEIREAGGVPEQDEGPPPLPLEGGHVPLPMQE